jgi:aldoxime dehydratase
MGNKIMSSQDDIITNINPCPVHMPYNWEPPVSAFSADMPSESRAILLYIGIQSPTSQSLSELNEIIAASELKNHDLAMFTDRAGKTNYVLVVYFASSPEHVAWEDVSNFNTWWESDKHLNADYGLWMERYSYERGQFETLFSSPDSPEGVCRQFGATIGPIREHGYSGAAEDRIPNSGHDKLRTLYQAMPEPKVIESHGKRLVLKGPKNVCVIRSGQDFTTVEGSELDTYTKHIEPALAKGLKFLGENSETGCFESRYMQHCEPDGAKINKTFGMQVFLSISHMIEWAKSHPTHLAIFNSFQNMAERLEGQFNLRLWHEIAVMDEGDSYAEYVNCHPQTGFLPFAHAL